MNTQATVHRLEAGQALPSHGRRAGPLVLAEGELLVQEPARWIAGTVVFPAGFRLVAPAVLPDGEGTAFLAVRASSVVVPVAEPVSTRATLALSAAVAWAVALVRHGKRSALAAAGTSAARASHVPAR